MSPAATLNAADRYCEIHVRTLDRPDGGLALTFRDDDLSIRRALTRLLTARGYAVHSYESAEDCLAQKTEGAGCVVLDLQLPERSGLDLLKQIAVSNPELSVIILSGHADVTTAVRAMKLGAVDLLNKPVEGEHLTATVAAACARSATSWTDRQEKRAMRQRFDSLTARERDMARLVGRGFLNKQDCVRARHCGEDRQGPSRQPDAKTQVNSVAELVRLLDRLGVQEPSTLRPQ
jgi:FixJ family two-component response regulator